MIETSRDDVPGFRPEPPQTQPPHLYEPYRATMKRAPHEPLVAVPQTLSEIAGHGGEPLGERIVVSGDRRS